MFSTSLYCAHARACASTHRTHSRVQRLVAHANICRLHSLEHLRAYQCVLLLSRERPLRDIERETTERERERERQRARESEREREKSVVRAVILSSGGKFKLNLPPFATSPLKEVHKFTSPSGKERGAMYCTIGRLKSSEGRRYSELPLAYADVC